MELLERLIPSSGEVLVDRYELGPVLGRGGFGIVFRAIHKGLDEPVAVKVLLPHVLANPDLVSRFEREVYLAKGLRHPNTIRILDFAKTSSGLPFYVMEFVSGCSLLDVIRRERALSAGRVQRVAVQILKSLAEAHANGVVHRDLKPPNVMLCEIHDEDDFVKVLDFGIAKALADPDQPGELTRSGLVLGTPRYMSPEQVRGWREVDPRSDLYTVGLIMAECLVGRPVAQGDSDIEVLNLHGSEAPLSFAGEVKSSALWPVIDKATKKHADQRYADAKAMRLALEAIRGLPQDRPALPSPKKGRAVPPPIPETTPPNSCQTPFKGMEVEDVGDESPAAPQPLAVGQADPEARTLAAGQETVLGTGRSGERQSRVPWILAALAAATLVVFALLTVTGVFSDSHDDSDLTESAAVDDLPNEEQPVVAPVDPGPQELPPEPVVVGPDPFVNDTINAAKLMLGTALPETHAILFDGTAGAQVSLNGSIVGTTPFEAVVPLVDRVITVRFERDRHESQEQTFSLTDEAVRVELSEERHHGRDRDRARPEEPEVPPFGGIGIHD